MRQKILVQLTMLAIFLGAVSIMTGCVTMPRQQFDSKNSVDVKTIAILHTPEPVEYTVQNLGGAAVLFGAIGGAIQVANNHSKTVDFTRQMADQKLHIGMDMMQTLQKKLQKAGYSVVLLSDQRPDAKEDGQSDYSKIKTEADAILDVSFSSAGYVSMPNSRNFEPWIRLTVRLISTKDKAQLYLQTFDYGAKFGVDGLENLVSNEKYRYDYQELVGHPGDAAEGITQGVSLIATHIVGQLH